MFPVYSSKMKYVVYLCLLSLLHNFDVSHNIQDDSRITSNNEPNEICDTTSSTFALIMWI
jgi:hypothetical protein